MKKLVCLVLLFCLVFSCAPAGAASARPFIACENGVLDLSGEDPIEFVVEGSSTSTQTLEELNALYAQPAVKLLATLEVGLGMGCMKEVYHETIAGITIIAISIDGDDTEDVLMALKDDTDRTTMRLVASTKRNCGPAYTVRMPSPDKLPNAISFNAYYYTDLTFLFTSAASDGTGSYELGADGATFVKPAKNSGSAKIPDRITVGQGSVPVTKIADNAFKNQKKLTKVTIGKNIKEIGKGAFQNCAKLKTVSGGANLEVIGDSAFSGCKALTKFTIGANVYKIGKKAFFKCAALKKITIKSKLLTAQTVGSSAFKGINAQATIKVPKAVKKEYTKWLLKKGIKKTMKIK